MGPLNEAEKRYAQALVLLSILCLAFFWGRVIISGTFRYMFIPWNLALAWLGLVFGWLLVRNLSNIRWLSWQNVGLTILWLIFLPNTWYVLTDFLHVFPTGEISELYDVVTMGTLVVTGFSLGFISLYLVHKEFFKRLGEKRSLVAVVAVILLASFAIYLGRVLRWNTWDVIANPGGLIINVSERIIDPLGHPRAVNITGLFFVLLCGIYAAIWSVIRPGGKSH